MPDFSAADPAAALRAASWLSVKLLMPMLGAGLLVGLAVAILQAVTQISDSTLSFLPKLLATLAAGLLSGAAIMRAMADFTTHMINAVIQAGSS